MAKASPKRTRSVNPKTIGGGFDLRDTLVLPVWIWIPVRLVQGMWKFRMWTFIVLTLLLSLFSDLSILGILRNLVVAAIAATIFLYLWVFLHYEHSVTFMRLTHAIKRRWIVKHRWVRGLEACGFHEIPPLKKIRYTPNGLTGKVRTDRGVHSSHLSDRAFTLASVLRAYEVQVNDSEPSVAYISIIWGDPTKRILYPEDIIQAKPKDQTQITFGLDPDHQSVNLSLTTSILIVGESEAGKSNCLWSILNGINEKLVPYKLWVIDPAGGVELNELEHSPFLEKYVERQNDIEGLITQARTKMDERLSKMKNEGLRKITINEEYPLNVIVIDELLSLPNYDPKSNLGQILSSGRKAGFIVIALSQLSQIDALGRTRDLFPQRLCHATKNHEMTDAALGSGAESAGANCSRIPKSTPGVGYYFSLDSRVYTRFRTPFITDNASKIIASGTIISTPFKPKTNKMSLRRDTAVYQFYGNFGGEQGRLLYVGIAYDPVKRQKQHQQDKDWWRDVDTTLTEIEWYPTRKQAKDRETILITEEYPVYNKSEAVSAGSVL